MVAYMKNIYDKNYNNASTLHEFENFLSTGTMVLIYKIVALDKERSRGANYAIRSVQDSCLHRHQLQI